LVWKMRMEVFASARSLVPSEQWLDIRFEDLLDNPQDQIKLILDFMGLSDDETFRASVTKVNLQSDQKDAFKRQLNSPTIALLESSLGEHLQEWGYR
jgi:hypothetical protein